MFFVPLTTMAAINSPIVIIHCKKPQEGGQICLAGAVRDRKGADLVSSDNGTSNRFGCHFSLVPVVVRITSSQRLFLPFCAPHSSVEASSAGRVSTPLLNASSPIFRRREVTRDREGKTTHMGTRQLVPPTPNPAKTRPTTNVAMFLAAVWRATPMKKRQRNEMIPNRRPSMSPAGNARSAPFLGIRMTNCCQARRTSLAAITS